MYVSNGDSRTTQQKIRAFLKDLELLGENKNHVSVTTLPAKHHLSSHAAKAAKELGLYDAVQTEKDFVKKTTIDWKGHEITEELVEKVLRRSRDIVNSYTKKKRVEAQVIQEYKPKKQTPITNSPVPSSAVQNMIENVGAELVEVDVEPAEAPPKQANSVINTGVVINTRIKPKANDTVEAQLAFLHEQLADEQEIPGFLKATDIPQYQGIINSLTVLQTLKTTIPELLDMLNPLNTKLGN